MHSIQTKTMLLTICAIVVAMLVATVIGAAAIRDVGNNDSEQLLRLLCETGEKNLDAYFESVEQTTDLVSAYVRIDLADTDPADFAAHIRDAENYFNMAVVKANGVRTYYYRIDPAYLESIADRIDPADAETVKGFWYVSGEDGVFSPHEVTDIAEYDTADPSALRWFTVPKSEGAPVWLPAYITETLDERMISYNVPVYLGGDDDEHRVFVGVVGIEIDYATVAEQVDHIKLYKNGYAFLNDEEGNIVYHPHIRVEDLTDGQAPKTPDGLIPDGAARDGTDTESTLVRYEYEGVKKLAVRQRLTNGMYLNVSVPVSEVSDNWQHLILVMVAAAAVVLVVFVALTVLFTRRFTKPLRKLTEAAEQINNGNYQVNLEYHGSDEIGVLTGTVNRLIEHLRGYISDLNSLAYGDALTSVRNKSAFDIHVREIQACMDDPAQRPEFAIGIFDCDDLKSINDRFGHEKGDMYLKNSSHLICRVFQHSPVFRIGGDEFAVVLQNEDYRNRKALLRYFGEKSAEICAFANERWEQIRVAAGIAEYDPAIDRTVDDVIRRADRMMYENKRFRKERGR